MIPCFHCGKLVVVASVCPHCGNYPMDSSVFANPSGCLAFLIMGGLVYWYFFVHQVK